MASEYDKCYVFKPSEDRPRKRRRLEGLHKSWPARRQLFDKTWSVLDSAFTDALQAVNAKPQADVEAFLNTEHTTPQLPCGVILSQPGSSSLDIRQGLNKTTQIVSIDPTAASNLKNALKAVNSLVLKAGDSDLAFTAVDDADDTSDVDDMREATPAKSLRATNGRRLLAYDLLILEEYVRSNSLTSVVVHLEDTEGFSGEVLSSLIVQLALWRDRIPLSMLLSLSTSVDMLERRLTSVARKKLKCTMFEPATCQQEFDAIMDVVRQNEHNGILGMKIIKWAAQRQDDFIHDITCLRNELKYALLTAFFANALTIFLGDSKISEDHFEALRITPAFKEQVQELLDNGNAKEAKRLLSDDQALLNAVTLPLAVAPPAHIFSPKSRQAIERALAAPQDYLGCDEHSNKTAMFSALLNESGNLVNVHDAWQAFKLQDETLSEPAMLALFQRALAELKHIGAIKSTRKRVDHVAKAVWPGL